MRLFGRIGLRTPDERHALHERWVRAIVREELALHDAAFALALEGELTETPEKSSRELDEIDREREGNSNASA